MHEDAKKGTVAALMMSMWDAYYVHHDEALLERVITKDLEFLINVVRQQCVPESEGPEEELQGR